MAPAGNALEMVLGGNPDISIQDLQYPAAFLLAGSADRRLVLPVGPGLVIPLPQKDRPSLKTVKGLHEASIAESGMTMPWVGVTDGATGGMMLALTPYDAAFQVDTDDAGYKPWMKWRDSKGRLSYERAVRFLFSDAGGYVALCKAYRKYAVEQGYFVSYRDKRHPDSRPRPFHGRPEPLGGGLAGHLPFLRK